MNNFKILIFCSLCLSFNAIAEEPYLDKIDYKNTPQWVEITPLTTSLNDITDFKKNDKNTEKVGEEKSVSYHLVDSQLNVSDGLHNDYYRMIRRINSKQGLSEASELYFNFIPDYQELVIHNINLVRNGKIIEKTKTELEVLRQEQDLSYKILTGHVTALAILEDVQVGDYIDYSYSVNGSNPIFNNKKFAMFATSWLVDVDKVNVRVITNASKPLNHKVVGSQVKVKETKTDQHIYYQWQDNNVQATRNEDGYPAWYQHFDSLEFSEFSSWEEVASWALDIYDFDNQLGEELTSQNRLWMEQSRNNEEYVERVVNFVQNDIRYFGIELSENSHKPSHPNETFERRFGDCKDKSLLISSLLAQHGIDSWSALVSAQNHEGIDSRLPSPSAFDHVINKVQIDNDVYWIDGTNSGQTGNLQQRTIKRFGLALLVDKQTIGLEKLKGVEVVTSDDQLEENYLSTGYDKPVMLTFSYRVTGEQAQYQRMIISQQGSKSIETSFLDYYTRQFPSSVLKNDVVINDDQISNTLVVEGVIEISDYWNLLDGQWYVPLYGENLSSYLFLPEKINRTTPLSNYENVKASHKISMHLHEPVTWQLDDKKLKLGQNAFNYEREIMTTEDKITVIHNYKPLSDVIAVAEIDAFVKDIKQARDELYYTVLLPNKNDSKLKLRDKMRSMLKL
jgi:hypothetical protein